MESSNQERCVVSAIAERKTSEPNASAKHFPPKGLVLRCIVFQNDTKAYTAECIDLDLLVYGKTPHEALRSLREQIVSYLEVALTGDRSGLMPRLAPRSHRARYHLYALRAALSAGAKRNFMLSDWSPSSTLCNSHL
jgi:hypothetical protein